MTYSLDTRAENTLPQHNGRGRRCRECKRQEGREYMRKKRAGYRDAL